jgi:hypothetical protein
VAVAAPPVAATPVSAGIEKKELSHAAGAEVLMLASLVSVTASGLLACPLAATIRGVVSVWALPLVLVAKLHVTPLGVAARQPGWVVLSALVVYPAAYVVFVGKLTPVIVTGNEFGFVIVTTTSPVPPG